MLFVPPPDDAFHTRTARIIVVAAVIAACAAIATWFMADRYMEGAGGPLVPSAAAIAMGGAAFVKIIGLLRRGGW
ncbi:hypothetical protein C1I98_21410 [Spongiactinospora gelatinilytica]|uniref:Uncharacterized protein n=1 Tax=Spongiactinospora gelatinilytica TaxID=2666298 RepID=A0A2W2HRL5_9ACTN|nr:hypothetical protein C1I98_21410 [Spongiactinospora gelatinilytica]